LALHGLIERETLQLVLREQAAIGQARALAARVHHAMHLWPQALAHGVEQG